MGFGKPVVIGASALAPQAKRAVRRTVSRAARMAGASGMGDGMTAEAKGRDLWGGGHFGTDPAPLMQQINASIGFDKRLWREDIAGSKAHARMLAACGIITEGERDAILDGLERIA